MRGLNLWYPKHAGLHNVRTCLRYFGGQSNLFSIFTLSLPYYSICYIFSVDFCTCCFKVIDFSFNFGGVCSVCHNRSGRSRSLRVVVDFLSGAWHWRCFFKLKIFRDKTIGDKLLYTHVMINKIIISTV